MGGKGGACLETSEILMELLEKINKEGKTIIMATHNVEILKKYKKRIIHVSDGKLSYNEKTEEK